MHARGRIYYLLLFLVVIVVVVVVVVVVIVIIFTYFLSFFGGYTGKALASEKHGFKRSWPWVYTRGKGGRVLCLYSGKWGCNVGVILQLKFWKFICHLLFCICRQTCEWLI